MTNNILNNIKNESNGGHSTKLRRAASQKDIKVLTHTSKKFHEKNYVQTIFILFFSNKITIKK
jgi:hypothetical protein